MKLLLYLSDFIVPVTILGIVAYGVFNKVDVYDDFIKGAKSGFFTVIKIMPTLIGLMVAVGILSLRLLGFFVGNNRENDGICWISITIGSACDCENVFFLGGNGIGTRYI